MCQTIESAQRSAAASELEHVVTPAEAVVLADGYLDIIEVKQHYSREEYAEAIRDAAAVWTEMGFRGTNLQRICNMTVHQLRCRRLSMRHEELVG